MKKIGSWSDLLSNVKDENKSFITKIKQNGGWNVWGRALAAQILWLTILYNIGILLIPVKDFLLSNGILVASVTFLVLLRGVIGDKIPSWVDDYVKGNFFSKFDVPFLNKWILSLFFVSLFTLYMNDVNLRNYKAYGSKQR